MKKSRFIDTPDTAAHYTRRFNARRVPGASPSRDLEMGDPDLGVFTLWSEFY
ncbi:MAG: hypothetical protein ACYCZE_08085 [Thiobacillus sp.]